MSDLRQQHGNHTWDIVVEYCRCPQCGYIFENREKYENRFGTFYKDFICKRCQHPFTLQKKKRNTFGPLLGQD